LNVHARAGGTLYHKYCAKLLQGWGGELGNAYSGTEEGAAFLAALNEISIKQVRLLIANLIEQGLDRKVPTRLSDQELRVVMSSTIRHIPLVKQLHARTCILTKDFEVLSASLSATLEHLSDDVLRLIEVLVKNRDTPGRSRQVSLADAAAVVPHRPLTAARKQLKGEGTEVVGPGMRRLSYLSLEKATASPASKLLLQSSSDVTAQQMSPEVAGATARGKATSRTRQVSMAKRAQREDMMTIHSVKHQLIDSIDDSSVPVERILECKDMIRKAQQNHMELEEGDNAQMDSDDEMALYAEIDAMTEAQERADAMRLSWERVGTTERERRGVSLCVVRVGDEGCVSKGTSMRARSLARSLARTHAHASACIYAHIKRMHANAAAKLFNQTALTVSSLEEAYAILHQVLCKSANTKHHTSRLDGTETHKNPASLSDAQLSTEDLAIAAAKLGAHLEDLDLGQVLEEVQTTVSDLESIAPHRNCQTSSQRVRIWALISSSPTFRKAIIKMHINEDLVDFMSSELRHIFIQSEARALVAGCRRRTVAEGVVLYDDAPGTRKSPFWTLILKGSARITRVLADKDKEAVHGLAEAGHFFGACALWKDKNFDGSFRLRREDTVASIFNENAPTTSTSIVAGPGCVVLEVSMCLRPCCADGVSVRVRCLRASKES